MQSQRPACSSFFGWGIKDTIPAYVFYAFSAYTLVTVILRIREYLLAWKKKLQKYYYFNKYVTDMEFKAEVSLYTALAVNVLYSLYEAFSGVFYHSAWFITLAFYYAILSAERFSLFRYIRKGRHNTVQLYKRYRFFGILLIALTVAAAGMNAIAIHDGRTITYPGHMIYVIALCSFCNLASAIINMVKYHKYSNPVYAAGTMVTLSTAIFSMFTLQLAMFSTFGGDRVQQHQMNIWTGTAVFVLLLMLSAYMIIRGTWGIVKYRREAAHDQAAEQERTGHTLSEL